MFSIPTRIELHLNSNLIFSIVFLGLLGWGLTWFFASEQFYIDRIVVTGNQRVSTDAVVEASGLVGYSVFWVNPRQVAASIVESLPPVRYVSVRYSLPNAVTLIVKEQGDQVMWQVAGDRYWVDESGNLHPALGESEPILLVKDIRPGLPNQVDMEAIVAARQVTRLLPEVRVIEYAPVTGLRFTHSRGWVVYLGIGGDMAHKVSVLRAMEVQFAGEEMVQPSLVDLRFPDSPYYRLPTGDAGGG